MKRDKLQTDQHLEKMIDNWKLREGPSNSTLLLNGLVHLEVNWFLESTDLMKELELNGPLSQTELCWNMPSYKIENEER